MRVEDEIQETCLKKQKTIQKNQVHAPYENIIERETRNGFSLSTLALNKDHKCGEK